MNLGRAGPLVVSSFFMAYTPKDSHPWRKYKNKKIEQGSIAAELNNAPPLKDFLKNMVDNWDTFSIPAEIEGTVKVKSISDQKTAAWLTAFIKKTWTRKADPMDLL